MAGFDENGGLPPYTAEYLRQVLFTPSQSVLISPNSDGWTIASWNGAMKGGIKRGGSFNHAQGGSGSKEADSIAAGDPKFILPLGVTAEIDCEGKQIRLVESATSGR
jgi:hypothetical protein